MLTVKLCNSNPEEEKPQALASSGNLLQTLFTFFYLPSAK
jgi:hypothetical protein